MSTNKTTTTTTTTSSSTTTRGRRSLVAGVNALFRAHERATRPAGERILDDEFAARFAERSPVVGLLRALRFVVPPLRRAIDELQTVHCVRHASIDALLRQLLDGDDAPTQVVVVGAGYDSRGRRFAREGVRFFEADHPATQARKLALLGDVDDVVRVPVDLSTTSLRAALAPHGFDPRAKTAFVVEGLVHYLDPARFAALLDDVAGIDDDSVGARALLLSFIRPEMVPKATGWFRMLVRAVREIPVLTFRHDELAAACARVGLTRFSAWRYDEQVSALVPQARGRAHGVSQDVAWAHGRWGRA
jgi:methyltransferase (TIGR00027 family)